MDEDDAAAAVRRARAAEQASPDGRLPLPSHTSWSSFPYEGDLRVRAVGDVVLPEPPRAGEDGVDCGACAAPDDEYLWTDADGRLRSTDEPSGLPLVLLLEPRVHADLRSGDGAEHLLPPRPLDEWQADLRRLATLLRG